MYYYAVKFKGNYTKEYYYNSTIKLEIGKWYWIYNKFKKYETPVIVVDQFCEAPTWTAVTIIKATPYNDGSKKVESPIEQVYYNIEKGTTTVKWKNGDKTSVKLQYGDTFDIEKAIAMCMFKHETGNGGAYNTMITKAIENAIDSSKNITK